MLPTIQQWAKGLRKVTSEVPTVLHICFCSLQFQIPTRITNPDMTTVLHAWLYGRFIEIQSNLRRKKLHRTNLGCNFLADSFSNRYNVRAPIHFRRQLQPQHLKLSFFLKNRSLHFYLNSTSVIRPVKWKKLVEFFQHWNQQATSCCSPQCLVDQIQAQTQSLAVVTSIVQKI